MGILSARAGASLSLTGRYAPFARQSARGLEEWASSCGATLRIDDSGGDDATTVRQTRALADICDIVFGPYGSGPMRAVAAAFADRSDVIWNHGGAAAAGTGARVIDVLAPARRYWTDLPAALTRWGLPLHSVAVIQSNSPFGREVAAGAISALADAGHTPCAAITFTEDQAPHAVARALDSGATVIVTGARYEEDVAVGRAVVDHPHLTLGMVACGVDDVREVFGGALLGWFGPCQWINTPGTPMPLQLNADVAYPAVQAFAAGCLAEQAVAAAGTCEPDGVWNAARALVTRTVFGDFAVDEQGRQTAHRPVIVRWESGHGGPHRHPA